MNKLELTIYLNTMEYKLSIEPTASPTRSIYPETEIDGDTIQLSIEVDTLTNPIFQVMESYVIKALNRRLSNVCDVSTVLKVLDMSLQLNILPLSDYKELINKLSPLFEEMEPTKIVEVKGLGEYCKCEVRPTSLHLPIFNSNKIIGYFEGGKLYMYDRTDMDECVTHYLTIAQYKRHLLSQSPSRKEYETDLLDRFENLLK